MSSIPNPNDLEFMARRLTMSAYLYYRRSSPVLGDWEYDGLTKALVRDWKYLSPFRQWQLGSAKELAASGFHIKITRYAEAGAIAWHKDIKGCPPEGYPITKWKRSRKWQVDYAPADA